MRALQADEDVVIAADAYDVLVMGGKAEILRVFEDLERESGKSLVFNAEPACFPPTDGICEKHPPAKWRWRFLNAGLIVGRAHAYKNPGRPSGIFCVPLFAAEEDHIFHDTL